MCIRDRINPMYDNRTLVQAIKLDSENYAFINTSMDPIDGTVDILQTQLIYVTIIVLILSFISAYFISRHISEPIVAINKDVYKRQGKPTITSVVIAILGRTSLISFILLK